MSIASPEKVFPSLHTLYWCLQKCHNFCKIFSLSIPLNGAFIFAQKNSLSLSLSLSLHTPYWCAFTPLFKDFLTPYKCTHFCQKEHHFSSLGSS